MAAYVVHRLDTGMSVKPRDVEQELERIEGDVVAIVPNIIQFPFARVNYLLIVERTREDGAG
jgi:hypothetical protein